MNVYWVRAGGEVRGPVPEAAVAIWLKQGMRDAEISVDGATFVPIARSTLAHLLEHAGPFGGKAKRLLAFLGPFCLFAFVMWSRFSRIESVHTRAKLRESLPKVGVEGELRADGASLRLCPAKGGFWGWPCSGGDAVAIAPGSHARVMKADLRGDDALCRYWIKGGPNNGAGGDALCAWFRAEVDAGAE